MKTIDMRLSVLALVFLLFSCKKDKSCQSCDTESGFKEATIINSGPVEADGCGWLVKIGDDKFYHPDVLDAGFRQNELEVKICYETTTDRFTCGIGASSIPIIRVLAIKK